MFFNVLICDDEYFIRQRLKKIIPWQEMNFYLIGEVENGVEAIEILENQKVDIIILDLNMPLKNGIEVARFIDEHKMKTKICILSGYNDFEYARQAIQYRACDYLLKPIEVGALLAALETCRIHLIEEIEKNTAAFQYKDFLLHKILEDWRYQTFDFASVIQRFPEFADYTYTAFLAFHCLENHENEVELLVAFLTQITDQIFIFRENESQSVLQIFTKSKVDFGERIQSYLLARGEQMVISFSCYLDLDVALQPIYKDCLIQLHRRFWEPYPFFIRTEKSIKIVIDKEGFLSVRAGLTRAINSKDILQFTNQMEEIFTKIRQAKSVYFLHMVLNEIIVTISMSYDNLLDSDKDAHHFVKEILESQASLEEVKVYFLALAKECMDKIYYTPSDVLLVTKIQTYVEKNFSNSNVTVSCIAKDFGISIAYLSRTFKKIVKLSLVQHINFIRLEKAKELLMEKDVKIMHVANQVGFKDVFYFSKKFKKTFGYSPTDYLNQK